MRQVDHDPAGVQPLDHLASKGSQAAILRRHRAVAQAVGGVVGQLDHADAQIAESVDPFQLVADLHGVLEAVDDPDLALVAGLQDIGRAIDLDQVGGMVAQDTVPGPDRLDRVLVRVLGPRHIAEGDIDRAEAGGLGVRDGAGVDVRAAGVGRRAGRARQGQIGVLQSAQRIDDQRPSTSAPG